MQSIWSDRLYPNVVCSSRTNPPSRETPLIQSMMSMKMSHALCSLDLKAAEEPVQSLDRHLRQHHHHQNAQWRIPNIYYIMGKWVKGWMVNISRRVQVIYRTNTRMHTILSGGQTPHWESLFWFFFEPVCSTRSCRWILKMKEASQIVKPKLPI